MIRRLALAALVVMALGASAPGDPADRLPNPAKEARARALFHDVRCLVCQSQSIEDSEAPLARDLRQLIRAQVAEGRSDAEVRDYLVSRYGEFVLLSPRFSLANAVLWAAPALVLLIGAGALLARRRSAEPGTEDLDEQEERRIAKLTDGGVA